MRGLVFIVIIIFYMMNISPIVAQVGESVRTGHTCSYFGESIPSEVVTFDSDQEAEFVIKDIINASGLIQNFSVRAAGVPNAAAVIRGAVRYILYSQHFMQETRQRTGTRWAAISIMAHEVGHHLNGHTLDNVGSRPKIELEADYYSGFILQRMGASLDEARKAMELIGDARGSGTHPPKHDRLAAITNGWTKSCGSDSRCQNTQRSSSPPPSTQKEDPRPSPPRRVGADSCEYAQDGTCDEPDLCEPGTDTTDCSERRSSERRRPPRRPSEESVEPSLPRQLYCCDRFGNPYCQILTNPGPIGSPCWCAGIPGTGIMCGR